MAHSTAKRQVAKVAKPRPDFPLFPHQNGQWAKKVRGRLTYFGKTADDPKGELAEQLWLDQKNDLLAGRPPQSESGELSIRHLANRFLTSKKLKLESGELSLRHFRDLYDTCELIINQFGKSRLVSELSPADFEKLRAKLAKRNGPVALGGLVNRTRSVFKFAFDSFLVDRPVRFGPNFKKPPQRVMRADKNSRETKMFEADEIRTMLQAASTQLKAMILLGVNAGLGNADCGTLPLSALDLDAGWLEYPRPKTAIRRRIPLWPETIEALRLAIATRPKAKGEQDDKLVFLTKRGLPWAKQSKTVEAGAGVEELAKASRGTTASPISAEMRKLLDKTGLYRKGVGFYALRHVAETIGGETADQVAVNAVMGHVDDSMAATYRERISDERLRKVTDYIRRWLFLEGEDEHAK